MYIGEARAIKPSLPLNHKAVLLEPVVLMESILLKLSFSNSWVSESIYNKDLFF